MSDFRIITIILSIFMVSQDVFFFLKKLPTKKLTYKLNQKYNCLIDLNYDGDILVLERLFSN